MSWVQELKHAPQRLPWRIVMVVICGLVVRHAFPKMDDAARDQVVEAMVALIGLAVAWWVQRLGHGWELRREPRDGEAKNEQTPE